MENTSDTEIAPPREEDNLLYHYTTQAGLMGILKERCIWATHVRYLNDASEFEYGLQSIIDKVENTKISLEEISPFTKKDFIKRHCNAIFQHIFTFAKNQLTLKPIYITSFFNSTSDIDAGDILGQWIAYSGKTSGICIGMSKEVLDQHIQSMSNDKQLVIHGECLYDRKQQKERSQRCVDTVKSAVTSSFNESLNSLISEDLPRIQNEVKDSSDEQCIDEVAQAKIAETVMARFSAEKFSESAVSACASTLVTSAFMKHPAFAAEHEWRIISLFTPEAKQQVLFRQGTSSLIPYIEIPFYSTDLLNRLIRRVVVGPTPTLDNAVYSVKEFIRSCGLELKSQEHPNGIDVVTSKIPYRSW